MRRLVPLLAALAALAGCSNREHANPLDPQNPHTGGAPEAFQAFAEDRVVRFEWTRVTTATVLGYRLSRRTGASGTFTPIAELPPTSDRYVDSGLANGIDYTYRLEFELQDGGIGPASEDVATPGPQRPWVADYSAHALLRLTPDARRVDDRITASFAGPADVDVDPIQGTVWVCDPIAGQLWVTSPGSGAATAVGTLSQPVAVAVDDRGERAWVCDEALDLLQSYDIQTLTGPIANVHGLHDPISVAVSPRDGSVWVCERNGNEVLHVDFSGGVLGHANVGAPSRVAVDSTSSGIWVTSFTLRRLLHCTADGMPIDSVTDFAGPIGVAVDRPTGRVWVADTGGNVVRVFDRNGDEVLRIPGLPEPREIALDSVRGEAWVTLPTTGQVAKIGPDGQVLRVLSGLEQPYDIALITGP